MFRSRVILIGILAIECAGAVAMAERVDYRITGAIAAPDFHWDLLSVDRKAQLLYVANASGVTSVELNTGKVTPILVAGKRGHGVIPIGETGTAVATSGAKNSLTWFDGGTGAVIAEIPTGKEPDTVVYEPVTKAAVTLNKDSHDATVIDLKTKSVVGTIALGGSPEFGVADGSGLIYDNIEDKNEIAVIDVAARKIVREIPLSGCKRPTGLTYDTRTGLLLSVCVNGLVKVIKAKTGHEVASLSVGKGADAIILDSVRRRVFVPCGGDGTLSVIALKSPAAVKVIQTLKTKLGVRTGAVNPLTGRVYLPSADFLPARKGEWPDVAPGTVKILIVSP